MTRTQKLYSKLLNGKFGRDVEYIANVILISTARPATKLTGLLKLVAGGSDVRCGNSIDAIRINGEYHFGLAILERCDSFGVKA